MSSSSCCASLPSSLTADAARAMGAFTGALSGPQKLGAKRSAMQEKSATERFRMAENGAEDVFSSLFFPSLMPFRSSFKLVEALYRS